MTSREQPRSSEGQQRAQKLADDLKMIITGEDVASVEKLDDVAKNIGNRLYNEGLTTSQIRNVFGEVRTIELAVKSDSGLVLSTHNRRRLMMLKPKLAYQVGREGSNPRKRIPIETLATILSNAIDLIGENKTYFSNFVDFFEAVLAYHRYYGGKNFSG